MNHQRPCTLAWRAFLAAAGSASLAAACTIAAISGSATIDGRPILWKNRDRSDVYDQEVRYFSDGGCGGYLALVTTGMDETTTAYAGVNDAGFAIVNADAPDLTTGTPQNDGPFMKQALMTCGSVEDFEALLIATSGSRGYIWSDFGVIDRFGAAAIFETNDTGYVRYDAGAAGGFVARTNFSVWGGGTPGSRYYRTCQLIDSGVNLGQLDHHYMTQVVAKDIGGPPELPCGEWPTTGPAISRYRTKSAAVIQGVLPAEDPRLTTFWCMLGEPSCGVSVPLWSHAGTPPAEVSTPGAAAPMCVEIQKKELYCYDDLSSDFTINTNALVGDDGVSGIQGYSLAIEDEAGVATGSQLAQWRETFPPVSDIGRFSAGRAARMYLFFENEVAPEDAGKAICDIDVSGTRSGTYKATRLSDDDYEALGEQVSLEGNRYSCLEHKWLVFVEAGDRMTFRVEAHHTANNEGDDFIFAYSVDDANYTDMVTVTKVIDDDLGQTFSLPPSLSGRVYVRVLDTDRQGGNDGLDSLFVDRMFIESVTFPDATPPVIACVAYSNITSTSAAITWATDEYGSSAVRYDADGGPVYDLVASRAELVTEHAVMISGLTPSTPYYYVVESTDASGNTATSAEQAFTTISQEAELHVARIDMSLKRDGLVTRGVAEVTVVNGVGLPAAEATVEGHWSGLTGDDDGIVTGPGGFGFCESDGVKDTVGWFVFTVDNLYKEGCGYAPSTNIETVDSISAGGDDTQIVSAGEVPSIIVLGHNRPDPFVMETEVIYSLPRRVDVTVAIYDVCGRAVRVLAAGVHEAGYYDVHWDGTDMSGQKVASGVYLLQLRAGPYRATEKMLLMR